MVSSEVVAVEQDALLATKLYVPPARRGLVPRPRLIQGLDEGLGPGVVLICAPAGYGKTVLLAEWARLRPGPVAWLSLDAGDDDPVRFWRHVVAALDLVAPGINDRVGPLVGSPTLLSFDHLLTELINELTGPTGHREALLILDDYHVITSPAVHASLGFLLEHRPAGLHVLVASRSDPPLALARPRAGGQLAELRAADMRFTADEATALVQHVAEIPDVELADSAAAALAARTEGWAAGLHLAALSLRGQADIARFVAAFTGSHRFILDYLTEEVLERQTEQMRAFLLETSVLERLSGSLCDAVTGRGDSQTRLEEVERAGLFLVPLDEVRGWWRYHHLFADLLRARRQPGSERAIRLHRNAANWYQEHGLADDAVHHAVSAGDPTWAARIIEQHFDAAYYLRSEGVTIQRWLAALPAGVVRSRPRLLLAQALLAATAGRVETVESRLDAAERAAAGAVEEPFEPTVGRAASMLVNVPALLALHRSYLAQLRGDAEATVAYATQALAESRDGQWLLTSNIEGFLAVAQWLHGRLRDAERALSAGFAEWQTAGQLTMTAWGGFHLSQIQRARGRLDAVARTCHDVLASTAPTGQPSAPAAGPALVCLADVAYQRNDLAAANRQVTDGIGLCRRLDYTAPLASGLATLAWIRQAQGDPGGALEAIADAQRASPGPAGLLNPIPAHRARLLLAQQDLAGAADWAQEQGLTADDEPIYPHESGYLVLARVLLADGRADRALPLLNRLYRSALSQQRMGSVIEIRALQALARAADDDEDGAVAALADALTTACPQRYVRVFVDEGPPMARLLSRLVAAQRAGRAAARVSLRYLSQLTNGFDAGSDAATPGRSTAVPGLVEALTSRELQVLGLLAAGRSNQAIADELVVTLDTVKKHVSHILTKLGGTNRTEAVVRARTLGMIR